MTTRPYDTSFQEVIEALLRGVRSMQESSVYQILEEPEARGKSLGQLGGIRSSLLSIGRKRGLGEPLAHLAERLEAITDENKLDTLLMAILEVKAWDELLTE
jgi:predicted transposase YdaD